MTVRVEVYGQHEVSAALLAMIARAEASTPQTINKVLGQVARQERTLLGLGRHAPGTPTGSPPGSPPWRIGGHLQDSVKVERAFRIGARRWAGRTGPTAVYGRIQELGGHTGQGHRTYLPPRPSLRPAWALVRPTVHKTFVASWR